MRYPALLLFVLISTVAQAQPVKRTILAIYRGTGEGPSAQYTEIHHVMAMPLNHLGLKIRYHDIRDPLPDPKTLDDVRGVLVATEESVTTQPDKWLDWLETMLQRGVQLVVVGTLAVDESKDYLYGARVRQIYRHIGLTYSGDWNRFTHNAKIQYRNADYLDFERPIEGSLLKPYFINKPFDRELDPLLILRLNENEANDAVVIGLHPNGGFVNTGYFAYYDQAGNRSLYLDPFKFFRRAFKTDEVPKADTTTLVGRRIYYSHIDGDGWNNLTEIPKHRRGRPSISASVVYKDLIKAYPDLPVSVAPIAGDLNPDWHGIGQSIEAAESLFKLPQVEAASHTYSHPLSWYFFADGNQEKEIPYLPIYAKANWGQDVQMSETEMAEKRREMGKLREMEGYAKPRAYAVQPFNIDHEINGSIRYISKFLPPGKEVKLVQWSGDTTPFRAALEAVRKLGLRNINGGDTRFDHEFPSYSWVAPVGWQHDGGIQIYASNSNENTYTDLWTARFFGFRYLVQTIKNTETPVRVKPFNIYYHMYSGEKVASLNAVITNLEYARTQKIAPIPGSAYAAVGDGFYSVRMEKTGARRWQVSRRDGLQTIRFDRAMMTAADVSASTGVLGQIHFQGSLYVALDPGVPVAEVVLRDNPEPHRRPADKVAYLVESRWPLRGLQRNTRSLSVSATGFGRGEMTWYIPEPGTCRITVNQGAKVLHSEQVKTDADGLIDFSLPPIDGQAVTLNIAYGPGA